MNEVILKKAITMAEEVTDLHKSRLFGLLFTGNVLELDHVLFPEMRILGKMTMKVDLALSGIFPADKTIEDFRERFEILEEGVKRRSPKVHRINSEGKIENLFQKE